MNFASFLFFFAAFAAFAFAEKKELVVIISADNGTFSGTHEQKYLLEKLEGKKTVNSLHPFCQSVVTGYFSIKGKKTEALLATSGIGAFASGKCTQAVYDYTIRGWNPDKISYNVKYSFLSGTSGWSPVQGGMMPPKFNAKDNATGCFNTTAERNTSAIGSVCVSGMAYDFNCNYFKEQPELNIPKTGYGECFNMYNMAPTDKIYSGDVRDLCFGDSGKESQAMVEKIMKKFPNGEIPVKVDPLITNNTMIFFDNYEYGIPKTSPETVKPFVYDQCMEASGYDFWVGAQGDYACRTRALQWRKHQNLPANPDQQICVTAMEGHAFIVASQKYKVNGIVVRGMSNFDMYPLKKKTPSNIWYQDTKYISSEDHLNFVLAGYKLAIETTNKVVLSALELLN